MRTCGARGERWEATSVARAVQVSAALSPGESHAVCVVTTPLRIFALEIHNRGQKPGRLWDGYRSFHTGSSEIADRDQHSTNRLRISQLLWALTTCNLGVDKLLTRTVVSQASR